MLNTGVALVHGAILAPVISMKVLGKKHAVSSQWKEATVINGFYAEGLCLYH